MEKVKFIAQVKYGRKFNYPVNHLADLFCEMVPGALSLTDWQLDLIRQLGFDVEQDPQVVPRNRKKRSAQ